jgi:hypothetical protein
MRPSDNDPAQRWLVLAFVFACAAKLWMASGQVQYALPADPYDDRLFLRLATFLLQGQWLGPYDQMTLAKGPFYPMFLAGASALGMQITVAQNLLYLAAAWLFVLALRPLQLRPWTRVLFLVALVLCPVMADTGAFVRAWRQSVWPGLVLFSAAGMLGFVLRAESGKRTRAAWATLAGLGMGAMWLEREEAVWTLPMLSALLVAFLWRNPRRASIGWACAPFLLAALAVAAVALQNYRAYGFWGIVEFRDRAFVSAYSAISRVKPQDPVRRIPVTHGARERIYAVSPAFASLRHEIEYGIGASFMKATQDAMGIPASEHEIGGAWMMWTFRDAVASTGHAKSAKEAQAFYGQLAREVNAACDDGRLPSGPPRHTLRPDLYPGSTATVWQSAHAAYGLICSCPYNPEPMASFGLPEDLAWVRRITHEPVAPADPAAAAALRSPRRLAAIWFTLHVYQGAIPWLLPVAGILWVLSLGRALWRRELPWLLVLSTALGLGLAGNILVVALVDALSFGAINPGYLGAGVPLAVCFVAIVLVDWAEWCLAGAKCRQST